MAEASVYPPEPVVLDDDPEDFTVSDRPVALAALGHVRSRDEGARRANGPPVGHDHGPAARVRDGYPPERGDDALCELLVRLARLPAVASLAPGERAVGEALLDLGPGQALPFADVDLAPLPPRP